MAVPMAVGMAVRMAVRTAARMAVRTAARMATRMRTTAPRFRTVMLLSDAARNDVIPSMKKHIPVYGLVHTHVYTLACSCA